MFTLFLWTFGVSLIIFHLLTKAGTFHLNFTPKSDICWIISVVCERCGFICFSIFTAVLGQRYGSVIEGIHTVQHLNLTLYWVTQFTISFLSIPFSIHNDLKWLKCSLFMTYLANIFYQTYSTLRWHKVTNSKFSY